MTLPSPRMQWYAGGGDIDRIQKGVISKVNNFVKKIGFYPIQTYMPILDEM